jgi:inhibitor of cysteine peptidase
MKNKFYILCSTILLAYACCMSDDIQSNRTKEEIIFTNDVQSITYVNPNSTVEVKKNKSFKIVLPSNPTTGYSWRIKTIDKNVIIPVTNYFVPSANEKDSPLLVGKGGRELWQFKAIQCGASVIRMVYQRSWETNVPPAREEIFKITVVP